MHSRQQTRRAAILPIKVHVESPSGKQTLLAHTSNISRSGCRIVVIEQLVEDSIVVIEYKHNRSDFKVTWCRPVRGLKHQVNAGLKKIKPDPRFWGEELSHGKQEIGNYTLFRRTKSPNSENNRL